MADPKLFRIQDNIAVSLPASSLAVEKSLQTLLERNLESMLGVRFLATEYTTGRTHGGRIDTLGLDDTNSPVIIEYKRAINENVMNQGLFYLSWLLDHRGDFKLLVEDKLGAAVADAIDWTSPRLICIAADFSRYDEHAVGLLEQSIELMRYRKFGDDLIALELLHRSAGAVPDSGTRTRNGGPGPNQPAELDTTITDLYEAIRAFLHALGDDVQEKQLKLYVAFRRIKNFAAVVVQKKAIVIYLSLDPATVDAAPNFVRDVSAIGHWATGDVEVTIRSRQDFERAPAVAGAGV